MVCGLVWGIGLRRLGCGCGRRLVTGSCVIRETTQTGCPWSWPRVSLSIYLSICTDLGFLHEVRAELLRVVTAVCIVTTYGEPLAGVTSWLTNGVTDLAYMCNRIFVVYRFVGNGGNQKIVSPLPRNRILSSSYCIQAHVTPLHVTRRLPASARSESWFQLS